MAIAFSKVGEATTNYNTSLTIPSFTPTANSLLILSVYTGSTNAHTVTGHGTWTKIEENTTTDNFTVWAVLTGGSPSASTIQVNYSGGNGYMDLTCVECTGSVVTSIGAAILQSQKSSQYQNATPIENTITLSAFSSASNATYITGSSFSDSGFEAPKTGFTAITPAIAGIHGAGAWYKLSSDTSPGYSASFVSGSTYGVAMEIAEETVDSLPPVFNSGPTVTATSSTGHTISLTANENCTIYGVRLAAGATAPSSAQVKAGQDAASSAAPEATSSAAALGVAEELTFSTGSPATSYDYYFVAEDASANLQASPSSLLAQSTEAGTLTITGGVLTFGAGFTFQYTGFSAITTTMTIGPDSQGNTLSVPVVDNGPSPATCAGTMPSLPVSGSASRILIEDGLTVTITEA